MKEQLERIRATALEALAQAADSAELESLRIRILGKKGELTAVLKSMGKLSAEERPVMASLPTPFAPASRNPWRSGKRSSPRPRWRPDWQRRPWTSPFPEPRRRSATGIR